MDVIKVKRLDPEVELPRRAYPDDAGLDLYTPEDVLLAPGEGKAVRTGIAMAIPSGHVGLVTDRSSMAKKGFKTAGGIIDAGYRGEVRIILWNITTQELKLGRGERIAQMLIVPIRTPAVEEVAVLDQTDRGNKGFGSSGK